MELKDKVQAEFPAMFDNCVSCGVGPGWEEIVYSLTKELDQRFPGKVKVLQVKEKFGGLRYYMSADTKIYDLAWKLVSAAEIECSKTCEFCGSKENVKCGGARWLKTLCEQCRKSREQKQLGK